MLVSKGQVASAEEAASAVDGEGNVVFNWANNSGTGTAKGNDRAILVAWFPQTKEAVFQSSETIGKDENGILELSSKKGIAETWLGFLSSDRRNAANSVNTRTVTL